MPPAARRAGHRPPPADRRARTYAYLPDGPGPEEASAKKSGAPSALRPARCSGQGPDSSTSRVQDRAASFQAACARAWARHREPAASTGGCRKSARPVRLLSEQTRDGDRRLVRGQLAGARPAGSGSGHPACLRQRARWPCLVWQRWQGWPALRPRPAFPDGHAWADWPHDRSETGLLPHGRSALPRFQHGAGQRRQSLQA